MTQINEKRVFLFKRMIRHEFNYIDEQFNFICENNKEQQKWDDLREDIKTLNEWSKKLIKR